MLDSVARGSSAYSFDIIQFTLYDASNKELGKEFVFRDSAYSGEIQMQSIAARLFNEKTKAVKVSCLGP